MNKLVSILILSLIFPATSKAQIGIVNLTFAVKDTNIIFGGVENYIKVSYPSLPGVKLFARHSSIEKLHDTLYKIMYKKLGFDTLELIHKNKVVYRKIFAVKEFELGDFYLGTIRKNSALKEEIIANGRLVYRNLACNCAIPHRVLSYRLSIKADNLPPGDREFKIEGSILSQEAISVIRKLQRNDTIEFSEIVALIYDGCPRQYPSLTIRIE
jgi:hypothetical protein